MLVSAMIPGLPAGAHSPRANRINCHSVALSARTGFLYPQEHSRRFV